jgi:hypothetical protein
VHEGAEVGDGALEAFLEGSFGLPPEHLAGLGDVGAAALGVAQRAAFGDVADAARVLRDGVDGLGELADGDLLRVAEVDRQVLVGLCEPSP